MFVKTYCKMNATQFDRVTFQGHTCSKFSDETKERTPADVYEGKMHKNHVLNTVVIHNSFILRTFNVEEPDFAESCLFLLQIAPMYK